VDLPHGKDYFDHWVTLFHGTLDQLFEGKKTEELKKQVTKMAEMFHQNIATGSNHNKNVWR
jgi:hemoglobin